MDQKKIIFVVGPTAVGKTEAAISLAGKLKGEIISCDSMQVYREISIASSKPSPKILKKVPHHLVNIMSIRQDFDVAGFRQRALAAIRAIHRKGGIPIVAGGSGMYMSVLLDGIFADGKADLAMRKALSSEAAEKGKDFLYQKLLNGDPEAAARIHPNDIRRIIRALEVLTTRNRPISQLQKERSGIWGKFDITIFALDRERSELYARIDRRVDAMFKEGLVDEIRDQSRVKWSRTAGRIIGVREIQGFLSGEHDLEHAKDMIKRNTRHYAKRQLTWFRKDKRLQWIMADGQDTPARIAAKMLAVIKPSLKKSKKVKPKGVS